MENLICKSNLAEIQSLVQIKSLRKFKPIFSQPKWIINNEFVLKVWDKDQYRHYEKEHYMLHFLSDKLKNIPKVKCSNFPYILMSKLSGNTLNDDWHKLSLSKKECFIIQICEFIELISKQDYSSSKRIFPKIKNWQKWVKDQFFSNLDIAITNNLIPKSEFDELKNVFLQNEYALKEQKMQIMYYDIHFGNFLIENDSISGILDFERVDWVSIDYCLNWIKRMDSHSEEYSIKKDETSIFNLFKKHYPSLFEFEHIEERLLIYEMLSDLRIKINKKKAS